MSRGTGSTVEVSWFCPLCDDDYEYLGVTNPDLRSSWPHRRYVLPQLHTGPLRFDD